ncbi:MAG: NfeD family protein [Planctomycetota bacterium]
MKATLCLWGLICLAAAAAFGEPARITGRVCLLQVSDQEKFMVDTSLASYIKTRLAETQDAALVILEIDTYGGELAATSVIREAIMGAAAGGRRVVAFIPKKAVSAGALITVSCPEIYMQEGAHFGNCAPVTATQEGLKMLNENDKITSVLRKDFETACRKYGYPYRLGHAMVSQDFATFVLYENSAVKLFSFAELEAMPAEERAAITGGDLPTRTEFYFPEPLKAFLERPAPKEKEGEADPAAAPAAEQPVRVAIDEVFSVDGRRFCFLSEAPDARKDFTALSDRAEEFVKRTLLKQIDSTNEMVELTAEEAYRYHFATRVVRDEAELFACLGVDGSRVERIVPSMGETVIRWFNHPVVAGLLMMIGVIAIYTELQSPGIGIGAVVAAAAFGLYFLFSFLATEPHYLPLILFVLGAGLVVVEIFVFPGVMVTAIAGVGLMLFGLLTVRLPGDFFAPGHDMTWRMEHFQSPLISLTIAILGGSIGIMLVARFLPRTAFFNRFVVRGPAALVPSDQPGMSVSNRVTAVKEADTGVAETDMRPAGKISLGGNSLIAMSSGDYIERGARVRVLQVKGNQVIVEQI